LNQVDRTLVAGTEALPVAGDRLGQKMV